VSGKAGRSQEGDAMRAVHWIGVIIVVAVVSLLALSNPEMVPVGLWPLPFVGKAPLYLVIVASVICGVLIGAATVWIEGHRRRHELREYRRQNDALARELAASQARPGREPPVSQRSAPSSG
jgi:uncharacterized integral membrane protein